MDFIFVFVRPGCVYANQFLVTIGFVAGSNLSDVATDFKCIPHILLQLWLCKKNVNFEVILQYIRKNCAFFIPDKNCVIMNS